MAFVGVLLVVLTACTGQSPPSPGAPPAPEADAESGRSPAAARRLTIFAAASLKDAFTVIGDDFRAAQQQTGANAVELAFSFAGSQTLRAQIEQGAPADVFAAADPAPLQALQAAGHVGPPATLAFNDLVVVRPAATEGSLGARTLSDIAARGRLVVATPEAPLGRYTATMFSRLEPALGAALQARVVSRELDARQVLGKVLLGEADAAVVYRTDAVAAGARVERVELPPDANVRATLAIAVVRRSREPDLAAAFAAYAAGPTGQARLRAAGFLVDAPAEIGAPAPPVTARPVSGSPAGAVP